MNKPSIFSFFSGAGFLDLGFEDDDFEIVYVNEAHEPFVKAYQHSRKMLGKNEPLYGFDTGSIEDISSADLHTQIYEERQKSKLVGFIGGPPCPDFSVAGKNRGKEGDNGKLSKVYVDLICELTPDFFLFENVKGLYRTHKHRDFFEALKLQLIKHNYALEERLINSIEYGAPQDRERIILVGFKKGLKTANSFDWVGRKYPDKEALKFEWPDIEKFEVSGHKPKPNNIPLELTAQYWFEKNQVAKHTNANACFTPRAGLKRFLEVAEGDVSRKSYKRLHRWRYSPTAAYGNNEVHLHPYYARRLTVAEALAIQSLPKDFELPSDMTLSNMFKTIGNGVPYLAAKGLASAIKGHIKGELNARNGQ